MDYSSTGLTSRIFINNLLVAAAFCNGYLQRFTANYLKRLLFLNLDLNSGDLL